MHADWLGVFLVLTVLTMTIGNVVALTQTNVKRMLAYSSIAHTGYIMAGLAAYANATDPEIRAQGIESVLFYVFGYAVMNIAAFAVVGMLQRDTTRFGGLNSFAGLAGRAPGRAAAMAVLMLSLTGIPPTVGFFAKLYVLLASVEAGLAWLAVIIVLNAAMAAFYYLRVIVYMYMRDPEPDPAPLDTSPFGTAALVAFGGRRRDPGDLPRCHPRPARGVGGEPLLGPHALRRRPAAHDPTLSSGRPRRPCSVTGG